MAPAVRKTTVMGVTCLSTGQVRGGSVNYVTMTCAFDFHFFAWDAVVKMNGLLMLPVPTVIDKLFFDKVAQLIQYACDCNPEYSVEAFDWDWASFHKNILLPNRMHIQLVMQLSDKITDRVVYSVHVMLNEWNGNDDKEKDDDVNVSFEKFFSVEDLDSNVESNKSNIYSKDLLIVMTN
jgi:hypothetical protein